MKKINFKEIMVYTIGLIVLGLGLTLSTKTNLGASALVAFPFAISSIYNLNLGIITLIYYIVFIIAQIIIHIIMKKYSNIINDIFQIVAALILSELLNILSSIIPVFNLIYLKVLFLFVAIIFVGVGISLMLKTKLPPNPPNGLIKTLVEFTKKDMGLIKNIVDITFVFITGIFSYIVCKKIIGIGIGTIIAMIGVGRVVYIFNKTLGKKIDNKINICYNTRRCEEKEE